MDAVAVGRLHYDIIGARRLFGIADKRSVYVSYISGKKKRRCFAVFSNIDINARRAEQMPRVLEAYPYPVKNFRALVISESFEKLYSLLSVLYCIKRRIPAFSRTRGAAVSPFRLKFLYMRRILQHYIAKAARRFRGVYRRRISRDDKRGKLSRMIYMRVCKTNGVDIPRYHRQRTIFVYIGALLHTAIHKYVLSARLYKRRGARDLMSGTEKRYLHKISSFVNIFFQLYFTIFSRI